MKRFEIICISAIAVLLCNCRESEPGQFPVDSIPPDPVSDVRVENLPGAVKLTYQIPDQEDILYVQAIYTAPSGEQRITVTSVFSNQMLVKGFGRSQKTTLQLITVDRSRNESQPLTVDIEPLDSPIYNILNDIVVQEAFGGFKLQWKNPVNEDVVVGILMKDSMGIYQYLDNFYSSASAVNTAVRGLDSIPADFGIFVRDTYDNYTDTLKLHLKPFYEQEIPKSGFAGMLLSARLVLHSWGGRDISKLWDGITNVADNVYYIQTGNDPMPYFTIDMGVKAKLSRFRWWQRVDFMFALHNPRVWEWWGTNDPALANNPEDPNWASNPGWVKLTDCVSHKPSGNDDNATVTAEDDAYGRAGEEFEFPLDAPSVRYLRFNLIQTWSGSSGVHIGELTFWGSIEKN
ncbi:MAG: DUF5126 domain-containing protein [Bacteroidales bacterium]|jgi:hypothetical protein|nr:DUF5126 domain-containing protein [Bacteroidales bacterium]